MWAKASKNRDPFAEIQANLLENSKTRLALTKAIKKQHKTLAEQAHRVLGKTACGLAAKWLLNKAFQVHKEHAGWLQNMARSIQGLQIRGRQDFSESSHTAATEPYFYDSAYQLVKCPTPCQLMRMGNAHLPSKLRRKCMEAMGVSVPMNAKV